MPSLSQRALHMCMKVSGSIKGSQNNLQAMFRISCFLRGLQHYKKSNFSKVGCPTSKLFSLREPFNQHKYWPFFHILIDNELNLRWWISSFVASLTARHLVL